MRIVSLSVAFVFAAALAHAQDSLVGTWDCRIEGQTVTLAFHDDGTYALSVEGQGVVQSGAWEVAENDLVLVPAGEEAIAYAFRVEGGTLVLEGGDLDEPMRLSRRGAPVEPRRDPPARGPLAGKWVHDGEFLHAWILFHPDGRYWSVLTVPGVEGTPEQGTYESDGRRLTIRSGGAQVTYDMDLSGDRMTLSGGNFDSALEYVKQPGSEAEVVRQVGSADREKTAEDERWRARFPLATIGEPFSIPAAGEIPADPNWRRTFQGATGFRETELYVWFTSARYMYRPGQGPAGQFQGGSKWHFQPNGRLYVTSTMYVGSVQPPGIAQPFHGLYYIESENTIAHWGRYRIAADDTFHVELDDGSTIDATFQDGRRNLYWAKGNTRCGNVEWENEALKRELEKDR